MKKSVQIYTRLFLARPEFPWTRFHQRQDNKYYEDAVYTKPSACDYSQNCHGYAFGVGDWPGAVEILNLNPPANACYEVVTTKDAKIACTDGDDPVHSIKVTGKDCIEPQPFVQAERKRSLRAIPQMNVPTIPPGNEVFIESSEQFRESGTYTQSNGCPDGVEIGKAHVGQNWTFKGYAPKKPRIWMRNLPNLSD